MCTLYLDQQGARLGKSRERLVVRDWEGGEQSLPLAQVDPGDDLRNTPPANRVL